MQRPRLINERIYAISYCASAAASMALTPLMPEKICCDTLTPYGLFGGGVLHGKHGSLHIAVRPMDTADNPEGMLAVIQRD